MPSAMATQLYVCPREVDALSEEDGRALKKAVIDYLMTFMEIFTSRSNLTARLSSLWTDLQAQLQMTKQDLQAQIKWQLAEGTAVSNASHNNLSGMPPSEPLHQCNMHMLICEHLSLASCHFLGPCGHHAA